MSGELPFVAAANRVLSRAWAEGWWPAPTLDGDALVAEACRHEAVRTIPGEQWREPFRRLISDLEEKADLHPLGRQIANGQLVTLLRMRVRAERLLRQHREILERPIRGPLIVLGHMRSGTTRLQRLLAHDPRLAHTRLFETLEPVPRRGRLLRAAAVQSFLERANPALRAIHPTGPLQPEEEFGLHSFSFHGAQFEAQWNVPGFVAFARTRDLGVPYGEFATLLKIIGWSRGDDPAKPWLLKSPQFTGELDAVLRQFPDAKLLHLSRDPVAVVASSASLVWNQRLLHTDRPNPQAIGAEWLGETIRRERATRAAFAANPAVRRLEVSFEQMNADWEAAMRRIYQFLELPLSSSILARMRRYLARSSAHRGHRYGLEQFGLSRDKVATEWAKSWKVE